jgi:signal transduction histidine kinase
MSAVVQFPASDPTGHAADTALLSAVMEACAEGLAILQSGCLLHANRGFAETFGYADGPEVEGRALVEFIPESLFLLAPDPESAMQSTAAECTGVRRDGQEIPIMAASAIFRVGQREFQVINLHRLDLCKPPKPQVLPGQKHEIPRPDPPKLVAHGLETMGRVVGSVAHDFNNLLTGILLYCDLLIRGLDTDSPLRVYAEEIRKAGGHSAGLIQQLFSAVRSQTDDSGGHSWNEVVTGMQNLMGRLLGESIELVNELDPRALPVTMNATAMRQIALNLLLNARDAMPKGGRITVTVRNCMDCVDSPSELLPGHVEFSVADTGCGMDAATLAQAFEPFFTTKAAGHGNGMGLSTIQNIVAEANGSLQVHSEPGQGTRICIRLPQVRPQPDLQQLKN